MKEWRAEIMTDPYRDHKLYVELLEGEDYRGRIYFDDQGDLQLQLYDGSPAPLPVQWLLGIIARFRNDVAALKDEK